MVLVFVVVVMTIVSLLDLGFGRSSPSSADRRPPGRSNRTCSINSEGDWITVSQSYDDQPDPTPRRRGSVGRDPTADRPRAARRGPGDEAAEPAVLADGDADPRPRVRRDRVEAAESDVADEATPRSGGRRDADEADEVDIEAPAADLLEEFRERCAPSRATGSWSTPTPAWRTG